MRMDTDDAISSMILSSSGWRGIFAGDGDEESLCPTISPAYQIIAASAAKVFAEYLSPCEGAIIVGRDTRPTGEAIARAVINACISAGREVWYTGVAAAPEIMALARARTKSNGRGVLAAGFIYISASHNPVGHNGIKFGLTDGGVLKASEAVKLTSAFKSFMSSTQSHVQVPQNLDTNPPQSLRDVYARESEWKNQALAAYMEFTKEVISGAGSEPEQDDFFSLLKKGLEKNPMGIVADFNGSSRAASIDRDFFSSLGLKFKALNETPGEIVNPIIPEGESLEPCRLFLEETYNKDPSFVMGYMCDCDGDRGNLVIMETPRNGKPKARVLPAQEVFALACVAELTALVRDGKLKFDSEGKPLTKAALVVNDPTSLRIDHIAQAFGVKVFRVEVGEANVVELSRELREQGYLVRIFGEGSNGGVIIHPSAVRDPINTLAAILKLLVLKDDTCSNTGLFEIWRRLSGQQYSEDFSLSDIINSLPPFHTTGAASTESILKVKTTDHVLLKDRYQKIFLREWEAKKQSLLEQFDIGGWEAVAYNGKNEERGIKRFSLAGNGGLKIEFLSRKTITSNQARIQPPPASIWMRGSKTEPVFRVIADAEGPTERLERLLINWQREMVLEADNSV